MQGRPPKPQLRLRGTKADKPAKKQLSHLPGAPEKPKFGDPIASDQWDKMVRHFTHLSLLSEVDGAQLERYCTIWATWKRLNDLLAKDATAQQQPDDYKVRSIELRGISAELLKIEVLWGISPAARARLTISDKKSEAPSYFEQKAAK